MDEKLKLLDDYMLVFSEEEVSLRKSLKMKFENFFAFLKEVKERN